MLEALGIQRSAMDVYRAMLTDPMCHVSGLAGQLGMTEEQIRRALDELADLALLRPSATDPGTLRPVNPELGLRHLLTRRQAELADQHRHLQQSLAEITQLAEEYLRSRNLDTVTRLTSIDAVRDRLEELAATATTECMSFMTGGAQRPDAINAGRRANQLALRRGVVIRSVFQNSFRNDPATVTYAQWLNGLGGQARTAPLLPVRMVIVDRRTALLPIDPDNGRLGAAELTGPGVVAALCALFELVWQYATPFGADPRRDANGLTDVQASLLRLIAAGRTDASAAGRLGLSLRTVRRMMADLMHRLGAESRFQAGVLAQRRGWL